MVRKLAASSLLLLIAATPATKSTTTHKPHDPTTWEKTIQKFEAQDAKEMPPKDGIEFVGSSSIVRWHTDKEFPDLHIINRGFGGSYSTDVVYYEDRIVTKYHPRIVLLFAGENDLAGHESLESVENNIDLFVKKLRESDPQCKILLLSFKPSTSRWKIWPLLQKANAFMKNYADKHENMAYIDITPIMFGDDGKPNKDMLAPDGLHPSEKAYVEWDKAVAPYLK